jgi:hypothetical protein
MRKARMEDVDKLSKGVTCSRKDEMCLDAVDASCLLSELFRCQLVPFPQSYVTSSFLALAFEREESLAGCLRKFVARDIKARFHLSQHRDDNTRINRYVKEECPTNLAKEQQSSSAASTAKSPPKPSTTLSSHSVKSQIYHCPNPSCKII